MTSFAGRLQSLCSVAFCLLFLLAPEAAAQDGAITGRVEDAETGSALAAVRVEVVAADGSVVGGAFTASSGTFRIADVPAGEYTVVFQASGWEERRESGVQVRAGEVTRVAVDLNPRAFTLNPITVSASRGAQKLLDAPASVSVVDERAIEEEPALTTLDHVQDVASVDVIKSGLQQGYVVTRGFNNVFSGSLLTLTDNRIARVPSLRANIMHLNPTTNLDISRVEVVRGPGSALYGPNAANGVLHTITKSPIDDPGVTFSVGGGLREQDASPGQGPVPPVTATEEGVFNGEARVAHKFSDEFGIKVSGKYFAGDDYRFFDPDEEANERIADGCLAAMQQLPDQQAAQQPACQVFAPAPGALPEGKRLQSIGNRDFELEEWSIDAEMEWRPDDNSSVILDYGRTQAGTSIDLTGIGAAQVDDWAYQYAQARVNEGDLFVQGFVNWSNGGDTFILRTGQPIDDESVLAVGQVQHSSALGDDQRFVYGVDVLRTSPRTNGSINGIHEQDDDFTEVGAYLQSETSLSDQWDLTLAARADHHSVLDEVIFSPRAALSFSPAQGHTLRATYNRAFSTPDNNNLFLDITAQRIPLGGGASYGLQAMGTSDRGFSFRRDQGGRPMMKSPFAPDPTSFVPTRTQVLWQLAVGIVAARDPQAGQMLASLPAPTGQDVGVNLGLLNTGENSEEQPFLPFPGGFGALEDIPPIQEEITNTWEVGYKGLIGERLLISVDGYFSLIQDFIGPLQVESPNAFLDGAQLTEYMVSLGVDPQTAQSLARRMAEIPLGVVQPREVSVPGPSMLLTYRNFGDVEVFGADLSAQLQISDFWQWTVATSVVSDETFQADQLPVNLNAPSFKLKSGLKYRNDQAGFTAGLDYRYISSFPASSGVFTGQVGSYNVFDLNLGYQVPGSQDVRFQVEVQNLFDERHRTFPGAPTIGRFTLARFVWGL